MHMVTNIGDTVSVISEVGLGIGEGKKPEDFLYDPGESSDDSEDWSSDDNEEYLSDADSDDEEYLSDDESEDEEYSSNYDEDD